MASFRYWWWVVVLGLIAAAGPASAADLLERVREQDIKQVLRLVVGSSKVLKTQAPISRISVANPEIVDLHLISEREIYIIGLGTGSTNLGLWIKSRYRSVTVIIEFDISLLKERLHQVLPNENISVKTAGDSIVLSGEVSSLNAMNVAVSLASAFSREQSLKEQTQRSEQILGTTPRPPGAPSEPGAAGPPGAPAPSLGLGGGAANPATSVPQLSESSSGGQKGFKEARVINLLHVGGVQQVMVAVRLAEINRAVAKRMGINFSGLDVTGATFGINMINNLTSITNLLRSYGSTSWTQNMGSSINAITGFDLGRTFWTFFFDVLKQEGVARVLAEPNLVSISGQQASFLAGGEYPYLTAGAFGQPPSTTFKPFGVQLSFVPVVLEQNKISLQIKPVVSELDFSIPVAAGGFQVPALRTRGAETNVELKEGQTLAIAGLLSDSHRSVVNKFPVLGDLPVLGSLFRSSSYQKGETELVVLVTPYLVKPLTKSAARLPTDRYVEPTDLEFYLLGKNEGAGKPKPPVPGPPTEMLPPDFGRQPLN